MVEADENGFETLAFYRDAHPPDDAMALFRDMEKNAEAWVARIVIGAPFGGPVNDPSLCLMTAARLVDHFVNAIDDDQFYGRSRRFLYAFEWMKLQSTEVMALFATMLSTETDRNPELIPEPQASALLEIIEVLKSMLSE